MEVPYIILHHPPELSLGSLTVSATLAASVNASLTPRFFIAEHSVAHISSLENSKINQSFFAHLSISALLSSERPQGLAGIESWAVSAHYCYHLRLDVIL